MSLQATIQNLPESDFKVMFEFARTRRDDKHATEENREFWSEVLCLFMDERDRRARDLKELEALARL